MRRFTSVVLAIMMVFMSFSFTAFADDKKANTSMELSSKSAILMDVGSGQILLEKNSHEKLPPASVTKVMTMLLAVEALDSGKIKLDDQVQISERASEMGGSQIFLEPGETQKVDDLLKGIAVASANDACVAMAEFIGGSEEEFVGMMNDKAKELGMKDTHFANTNGLPVDNHYTSAHDIALMSKELLKHEKITKYLTTWMDKIVVGKKQVSIGLANTNKMIKHYQGATGVKTGFTQEAKYCLSASAKRGETHLVAATLGAPTTQERFKDASSLLSYGFANYESVKLCSKGDAIATLKLDKAEENKVNLVAKEDLTALIKKGESKDFTKKIQVCENIKMPVKKGTKLGTINIYKGNNQVGKVDLVNEKDINKASYFRMFERVIDNMF
ncbi:D-alanyl-D-alanine carboxypeptidase family protein [Paraclostridium bifermentans]|uniref:D-alanyl-D-alanine carboxypeptidase family protein n=1 Tax=Paraclostridium bifermentans TaxID=1490 RepID=UPI00242A62B3|nr:D-alanyl-D-alanine carboxypeptidase family protein [Paraclostridium bifermentans]